MSSVPPPPLSERDKGLHLPKGIRIPDWRQYKVEDVPELLDVQKKLAARGLKSPWLRNEVWRYDVNEFGTMTTKLKRFFLRGTKTAAVLLTITLVLENTVFKKEGHGHGHGHAKDHAEHH